MSKQLRQVLAALVSFIAAVFGLAWIKRKLEDRGAEKQRRRQLLEAARTEVELGFSDATIDAEAEAAVREIQQRQAERHRAQMEADQRTPTQEEIDRFIAESK